MFVDLDVYFVVGIDVYFFEFFVVLGDWYVNVGEGEFVEFMYGVCFVGGDDVVVGFVGL